ncbi:MAG: hypothetical protein LBJ18_00540 [Rickettsiales bacterium]|jgi:hypothetical protein|nr:hypothetical protein [Rickettsiales bacterium]
MFDTPILYIVFNRPDYTEKSFAEIRKIKPAKLYIAGDGARQNRPGEQELVESVRRYLLDNIDWECEVHTRFQDNNIGCGKHIAGAITWFFQNEPYGIIIEDDVIPDPTFWNFCAEMLKRYKDDKRVWHINGRIFQKEPINCETDYMFMHAMHACGGWASWADRWLPNFEYDLREYDRNTLKLAAKDRYWRHIIDNMCSDSPSDAWDYQWGLCIIANHGLCVMPTRNLINNIGVIGVHFSENSPLLNTPTFPMPKRLCHPEKVEYDRKTAYKYFGRPEGPFGRIWRHIKTMRF